MRCYLWAILKLGIDEWLVPLVQSKDVKSRVRVDNRYREEFGVGVGIHQGSVLLLIIVLEALSRNFCTCCPWELLYADDLMISAESMEELQIKVRDVCWEGFNLKRLTTHPITSERMCQTREFNLQTPNVSQDTLKTALLIGHALCWRWLQVSYSHSLQMCM